METAPVRAEVRNIVIVCSIEKWPWLREAYNEFEGEPPEHDPWTADHL